jgi:hypothetical protein
MGPDRTGFISTTPIFWSIASLVTPIHTTVASVAPSNYIVGNRRFVATPP